MALTDQQTLDLRNSLKRCRPEEIDAAIRFRNTGDTKDIPMIVYGIIERHLPPETRRPLGAADDNTRLVEDLAIDSLTLLEIVLSIEEGLDINVENDELKDIRTLGEVKRFISRKVSVGNKGLDGHRAFPSGASSK